jgi:hypothetical protein
LLPDHPIDAQLLPQAFEDVGISIGPGTDQAPFFIRRNDLLRTTATQDASRQPPQPLDDFRIVIATTVMDDRSL